MSYAYESNMETQQLMDSNTQTMNVNETSNKTEEATKQCDEKEMMMMNGDAKPECIEMSTSTTSIKCCNGLLKSKKKEKMVKQPTPIVKQNGQSNGKCYFGSLKAKFSSANGKYHVNGKCNGEIGGDVEACLLNKKPCKEKTLVFDDRDPFKISSNVKFEFLNVFAEPNSGTYSFTPTWSFTSRMYFNLKLFIYRLLAILIGMPCAFICAIFFALFSVFQIWIFSPLLRLFKALLGMIRDIWATIIDTVFGPIVQLFQSQQTRSYMPESQCPSSVSSKSVYNENLNNVV